MIIGGQFKRAADRGAARERPGHKLTRRRRRVYRLRWRQSGADSCLPAWSSRAADSQFRGPSSRYGGGRRMPGLPPAGGIPTCSSARAIAGRLLSRVPPAAVRCAISAIAEAGERRGDECASMHRRSARSAPVASSSRGLSRPRSGVRAGAAFRQDCVAQMRFGSFVAIGSSN